MFFVFCTAYSFNMALIINLATLKWCFCVILHVWIHSAIRQLLCIIGYLRLNVVCVIVLYVQKDSFMVCEKTLLLSLIELQLFFWGFHTWTTKWTPYMSVILRLFFVCIAKCVTISMSKYLPISTNFGTKIPQCNTSRCFFLFFQNLFFRVSSTFLDFVGSKPTI